MPARNVAPFIDAAVRSILDQRFEDFELIIRDDGSTDATWSHLCDWAARDARVRIFQGERLGLAGSSNWIVQQARAPVIARMDGDDIARPDRLDRQLQALADDPGLAMVGSLANTIDTSGRTIRAMDRWRIARRSWFAPFPHTSIMFQRTAFDLVGGYRALRYCEDLDFFLRISSAGRVAVIADALVSHRVVATSASATPEYHHEVVAALDRMLATLPPVGGDVRYSPVSAAGPSEPSGDGRLNPLAIVYASSALLWAGGTPRSFTEMTRKGRLGPNVDSATALVWALLAQYAPSTLRRLIGIFARAKNLAAAHHVKLGKTYGWRPGNSCIDPNDRGPTSPPGMTLDQVPSV